MKKWIRSNGGSAGLRCLYTPEAAASKRSRGFLFVSSLKLIIVLLFELNQINCLMIRINCPRFRINCPIRRRFGHFLPPEWANAQMPLQKYISWSTSFELLSKYKLNLFINKKNKYICENKFNLLPNALPNIHRIDWEKRCGVRTPEDLHALTLYTFIFLFSFVNLFEYLQTFIFQIYLFI